MVKLPNRLDEALARLGGDADTRGRSSDGLYGIAIGEMQVALIVFIPAITAVRRGHPGNRIDNRRGLRRHHRPLPYAGLRKVPPGTISDERNHPQTAPKTEFGGVVLIGPIPIIFGSSKRAAMYVIIVAIVILVLLVMATILSAANFSAASSK